MVTNCHQLKMRSPKDGKRYNTDVANTEQLLRIIQSIPSKKAEPFKMWLAKVGRERIEEVIDTELTIERALETYAKKGYFSTDIFEGEMAHARFYDEEIRKQIPKCHYRKYTISEIINSIIGSGFTLERFDEHPSWENEKLPGEFTAIARKR